MEKKILALLGVFFLIGAISQASVVQGSVPNHGSKAYTFTPDFTGIALLSLIFESNVSDLDIRLAVRDSGGNLVPIAFSESELKRQEELQIGVLGQTQYTILVFSSSGASPFRLSFEGTFTTSRPGQAGATNLGGAQLQEVQHPDAALLKFMADTQKLAKRKN